MDNMYRQSIYSNAAGASAGSRRVSSRISPLSTQRSESLLERVLPVRLIALLRHHHRRARRIGRRSSEREAVLVAHLKPRETLARQC